MAPPQMPLPMGPNFHTLPSNPSGKTHMQAMPEYSSHTLTLKREKSRLAGGVDPSCGKPVYVCDGELFKQLDADMARGHMDCGLSDGSGGVSSGGGGGGGYVLMPNTTSTLRTKPKEDMSKYNISLDQLPQLPQTRLVHLSGPFAEPQAAFGLQQLPSDQVSVSYSERDSPIQNLHNMSSESHITHSSLENTFESMNSMMSKSETISTLSMSSLEVRTPPVPPPAHTHTHTHSHTLFGVRPTACQKGCCYRETNRILFCLSPSPCRGRNRGMLS